MSPSDYLKVQTELLLLLDSARRLPLAEFRAMAAALGTDRPLYDRDGLPVTIAVSAVRMADCAMALVACGPHAERKPVARECGAGVGRKEMAG